MTSYIAFLKKMKQTTKRAKNRKGMVEGETALWILALLALVVLFIIVFLLKSKGVSVLDKIFEILRFGR